MNDDDFDRLLGKLRLIEDNIHRMKRRMFWMGWACGVVGAYLAQMLR
jgi:hypothetical protein